MHPSDELAKLSELHQRGALSDDEFSRAKARVLNAASPMAQPPFMVAVNGLRRSRSDRWIGGVCAGLGALTGLAPWAWRLILVVLLMFGGTGLLIYLLLWIFVPEEDLPAQQRLP